MWHTPSPEQLARIPRLYTNLHIPRHQRLIYLHLTFGGSQFFVAEISESHEFIWAFSIIDFDEGKWRVSSLSELKALRIGILEVANDRRWVPRPALEVFEIRNAHPAWRQLYKQQHARVAGCRM